ncbi:hypothetical protein BDY21DRAFT_349047 [Lineolata rhizophorae]|uniref:Arrestin C-terminal-like domain-containing protein n=1 Tax=Lineolata rhizophorae TaxID=578093 RepID=A0A6A6NW19_9PEZI|nr:hypothetical protein BDY21DRAFT_349047 [Lineolata rhizophorae]
MAGARRHVFLNLASELIDAEHPPPHNMVESLKQLGPADPFWMLAPSAAALPFMLSLPLDVGPPPFGSKHARIRYVLCVTVLVRDSGKQYIVRTSQDVAVLSVYDPEKALMSLPSPLTASDEYIRHRDHGIEIIRLTAGLHRQVWVSGTSIFVDVHIANSSKKTIKRMELQLERDILCYKHTAATTLEKSANQLRIFDNNERSFLSKSVLKQSNHGWSGVAPHTTHMRTCDLEIPRGHATVKCGKYFEVRYFLNINLSTTHTKILTVQLPIVLIHMVSSIRRPRAHVFPSFPRLSLQPRIRKPHNVQSANRRRNLLLPGLLRRQPRTRSTWSRTRSPRSPPPSRRSASNSATITITRTTPNPAPPPPPRPTTPPFPSTTATNTTTTIVATPRPRAPRRRPRPSASAAAPRAHRPAPALAPAPAPQ